MKLHSGVPNRQKKTITKKTDVMSETFPIYIQEKAYRVSTYYRFVTHTQEFTLEDVTYWLVICFGFNGSSKFSMHTAARTLDELS